MSKIRLTIELPEYVDLVAIKGSKDQIRFMQI